MKVSLFITCLCDSYYPQVGKAVINILNKYGVQIDFPPQQVCCGQPAFNTGYWNDARGVAKTVLESFKDSEYVVAPSGSCVAFIKEYYPILFEKDSKNLALVKNLSEKIYEFSQFLVDVLKIDDLTARFPHKVAYHPSCHAMRLLGVTIKVIKLLDQVKEMELVKLAHAEDCCGFGGTFSVKLPEISQAIVKEKVTHIIESGASVVTGTDLGCLMNIDGCLKRLGSDIRTLHIAQLLDEGMSLCKQ